MPGIICDKKILGGKPVIKGTRIPVGLIMGYFANNHLHKANAQLGTSSS